MAWAALIPVAMDMLKGAQQQDDAKKAAEAQENQSKKNAMNEQMTAMMKTTPTSVSVNETTPEGEAYDQARAGNGSTNKS